MDILNHRKNSMDPRFKDVGEIVVATTLDQRVTVKNHLRDFFAPSGHEWSGHAWTVETK